MKIKYRTWGKPPHDRFKSEEVEAELLPCPMCTVDREQVLEVKVVSDPWHLDKEVARGLWAVECGNCGCVMPGFDSATEAVAGWNNRTEQR